MITFWISLVILMGFRSVVTAMQISEIQDATYHQCGGMVEGLRAAVTTFARDILLNEQTMGRDCYNQRNLAPEARIFHPHVEIIEIIDDKKENVEVEAFLDGIENHKYWRSGYRIDRVEPVEGSRMKVSWPLHQGVNPVITFGLIGSNWKIFKMEFANVRPPSRKDADGNSIDEYPPDSP
ncbi:uncharacterized protein MELLADRAFT_104071 [Melampsora larici-populina 98AG31]|uniref:Secreted protein n=1 Tax=Melampsora larici-populina (strain 98AG31 / pathotype 3-4-7) TaxID=747676 RepID=F4RDG4_MELLP|nr:uncharacterized protein MELLADRAFT_104071 [Melampsora larici-populina 98AG31]EGG09398.1 hypothetical protein MELLADRAFT_104071 [Melampsora larici-populina 98AG31]